MITVTKKLRKYAIAKLKGKADATDRELSKLIGDALVKGTITSQNIKDINAGTLTAETPAPAPKKKSVTPPAAPPKKKTPTEPAPAPGMNAEDVARLVRRGVKGALKKLGVKRNDDMNPADAMLKSTRIRVKEAAEGYDTTRKMAVYPNIRGVNGGMGVPHPLAGMPAKCGDVNLSHPSDRDKAVALSWVRYMVNKDTQGKNLPAWLRMTDHDRELVLYAVNNEKWVGNLKSPDGSISVLNRQKLDPGHVKTLLDDTVSGGIEITPIVFDDALVLIPVLYGELFPFVRVETIARGRRVKGGALVNPTFTSGVGEGTAITPFNTASYVTAFDTPIYPAVSAIELGQDFEEDSVSDLGGQVIEQFGLKALEWLDRVVAVGDGLREPQGFFNAPAATIINSDFGSGGPLTVSDAEGLMFGLPKQFRAEAGAYLAYVSNDYTYRKFRSTPVGAGDERRVFGMDHAEYKLLGYDHKIQNDIADGYAAFVNLRRYRMYRRLGMQVRVETGGRQLALSNTRLIVVRMRYGGQLELGSAAALMKDAQVM